MNELFLFLAKNDVWIFFVTILALIWYLLQLRQSTKLLRRSSYGMERESAHKNRTQALLIIATTIGIAGATLYANQTIPAEQLRPEIAQPSPFQTPTPLPGREPDALDLARTPQPTIEKLVLPTATPIIAPTATLQNPDVLNLLGIGVEPTVAPSFAIEPIMVGCNESVTIIEPSSGSTISGRFSILGSAFSEDFSYYDVQMTGPSTSWQWRSVLRTVQYEAVEDGVLGNVDVSEWQTGVYHIQVVLLNTENLEVGRCLIQVGLQQSSVSSADTGNG